MQSPPYGAPPGPYGAPSPYGAPPGPYGAPPGPYGMPPAGPYGAPAPYGAPYGMPPMQSPPPGGAGGPDNVLADIDRFVKINRLEPRCDQILRELSPSMARRVMGLDGGPNTFELRGDVRNPTGVVIGRVRKAREGGDR